MTDAVWNPRVQQQIYRRLLSGMSWPGTLQEVGHLCGPREAWLGILATLCDPMASLSDPEDLIAEADWPFLAARCVPVGEADYILMSAHAPPSRGFAPKRGTLLSPELGATLILKGTSLSKGPLTISLTGPGIREAMRIHLSGFHPAWFQRREDWGGDFPEGVDLFLTDRRHIMALPRTSRLEITGE